MLNQQPWIGRPYIDIIFILSPPFISLLIVVLFPGLFRNNDGLSDMSWVILVLMIDVAHVYSTFYRTYLDPQAFQHQRFLLYSIPLAGFVCGVLLYSLSSLLFWRVLAYVAVFHFVRQQYGFMRVYSRRETKHRISRLLDTVAVYAATLYPLLYWHLGGPKNFNWFIEGDFVYLRSANLLDIITVLYFMMVFAWLVKEIREYVLTGQLNIPKISVILGTMLSWYFGIVYFNGDMAFTLLNVVSHGVPYMALVWLYGRKNYLHPGKGNRFLKLVFSSSGIIVFLGLLFLFAYAEEGLWDMAVWKEHSTVFGSGQGWRINEILLSILVPLLALPQITHYILDGFIWKIRKDEFKWKSETVSTTGHRA